MKYSKNASHEFPFIHNSTARQHIIPSAERKSSIQRCRAWSNRSITYKASNVKSSEIIRNIS
jgi:hypothetical protein